MNTSNNDMLSMDASKNVSIQENEKGMIRVVITPDLKTNTIDFILENSLSPIAIAFSETKDKMILSPGETLTVSLSMIYREKLSS